MFIPCNGVMYIPAFVSGIERHFKHSVEKLILDIFAMSFFSVQQILQKYLLEICMFYQFLIMWFVLD